MLIRKIIRPEPLHRGGKGRLLLCSLFLGLFFSFSGLSQHTIGLPNIINYTKQEYGAGNQNWNIIQDAKGILYFANNNGLLSFDGRFWRTYPLPNNTIVRSLALGDHNRIYTGGQGELGYFYPDGRGKLTYISLKNLLPVQDHDFADIWNIRIFNKHVFFHSNKRIFEFTGHKIITYKGTNWGYLGGTPNELIACDNKAGIVAFRRGAWVPIVKQGSLPPAVSIRSAVSLGRDSILMATLENGLYLLHHDSLLPFRSPDIDVIAKKNVYGAYAIGTDKIALVTNLAGCMIIDKKGAVIQRFSKREGLQNNNVLSLLQDRDNNLWLGLDNGIDLITYGNAITNIFPDTEDRNSGYTSFYYHKYLYVGDATGIYRIEADSTQAGLSFTRGSFARVKNLKGQIWNLSEVNGRLLAGHNSGAYLIADGTATAIDSGTGFWLFQPLYPQSPSPVMVAGTYNGLNFYSYAAGAFTNLHISTQFESARFVTIDHGIIWIAHPYKGLYKVVFNRQHLPQASVYRDAKGILSVNHNHIYFVRGRTVLTSDNGIFEYSPPAGDFIRSAYFSALFKGQPVDYLKEDKYGNIWFCNNKKLGVVDGSKGGHIVYISELNDKIMASGFENITIVDSSNVFIAGEKGFFHLNYTQYKKTKYPLQTGIRWVRSAARSDSILFGGYTGAKAVSAPEIAYAGNSLHFEFSAALYGQEGNIEFSYRLKGFDKTWSDWSRKSEKDYTNLPAGSYRFEVRGRNNIDNVSAVAGYAFTILPPWYQTWWAYTFYAFAFTGLLYLFYKRQQQKYKRQQEQQLKEQQRAYLEEQKRLQMQHQIKMGETEKQILQLRSEKLQAQIEQKNLQEAQERLHFEHQLEVEKSEKEIIRLRNEKLQAQIEHNNSELASSAMNLVRKIEMLTKLKEDLNHYKSSADKERGTKEFQKIIRVIDKELDYNQEWEQFAQHFDSIHTNYLKKLKEHCPDLTSSELKLSAYLRLNLSTKEIAQLMNISTRGVETSRYRLRKKLHLSGDVNLFDYLIKITS